MVGRGGGNIRLYFINIPYLIVKFLISSKFVSTNKINEIFISFKYLFYLLFHHHSNKILILNLHLIFVLFLAWHLWGTGSSAFWPFNIFESLTVWGWKSQRAARLRNLCTIYKINIWIKIPKNIWSTG